MSQDLIVPASSVAPIPRLALTPREASQALGVSERTIGAWISEGILPSTKIGRCRLLPVDALRQWLVEKVSDDQDGHRDDETGDVAR